MLMTLYSTVNRSLALMKRMYTLAINEGIVSENPVKKVKFFSEADTIKERILTQEEEARLMAEAPPHLRSILIVALNTGMRFSEVVNLEWKQVDINAKRLRVENTKSHKVRFININAPLLEELTRLRGRANGSPCVFPNPGTGKPYFCLHRSFVTACKKAGVQGLRFHDLRHTFASRLDAKGVGIETIRDLLGHSSVVLTQRYLHTNNQLRQQAVDLLGSESGTFPSQNGGNLLRPCDTAKKEPSNPLLEMPLKCSELKN